MYAYGGVSSPVHPEGRYMGTGDQGAVAFSEEKQGKVINFLGEILEGVKHTSQVYRAEHKNLPAPEPEPEDKSSSLSSDIENYLDSGSSEKEGRGAGRKLEQRSGTPYYLFKVKTASSSNPLMADMNKNLKYDRRREDELDAIRRTNMVLVEKLAEDLILLIFKEAKMSFTQSQLQGYRKWLYDKLWLQAELVLCHLSPEKFLNLHQALYRDLTNLRMIGLSCVTCVERAEPVFANMAAIQFRTYMMSQASHWKWRRSGKKALAVPLQEASVCSEPAVEQVYDPVSGQVREQVSVRVQVNKDLERSQERCQLLLHQYLSIVLRRLFEGGDTDYTPANFLGTYQRIYDKLWALCERHGFALKSVQVFQAASRTVDKLVWCAGRPRYAIMKGLSLKDPVVDDVVLRVFRESVLKERSRLARFFSALLEFVLRPIKGRQVFDAECMLR